MHSPEAPRLAPPGAGLPFPENQIARLLLAFQRATGNPDSFIAQFIDQRAKIGRLLDGQDEAALSRRVLIARPPGLEDSSRYWSVRMTLDHLRIVHHAFIGVLDALSHERIPEGAASTAAVKPSTEPDSDVVQAYEDSCDSLLATIRRIGNFKTHAKFPHPWFGPLDAHGWLALAGSHISIHRVQIERILKGGSK